MMSRGDSEVWFRDVVPELARLLIKLPALLEEHYLKSDELFEEGNSGLRILGQEEAGMVMLSQELIAALLACALFCLFPTLDRDAWNLPHINFDRLFASLHFSAGQNQEQKVKCLIHYFERVGLRMGAGYVSFERKFLPFEDNSQGILYPEVNDWGNSSAPLCSFEVFLSGLIEDQEYEALEVDFANKCLGGGALSRGCVQEEIRFMINPELIAGMLFMVSMNDNEAIEIVGAERFSCYMGYGSSFRFTGDYLDNKPVDYMGRRKTRIVAIDAILSPGRKQYGIGCLLREANKAFCGFLNMSKCHSYPKILQDSNLGNSDSNCQTEVYKSSPKQGINHDASESGHARELERTGKSYAKNSAEIDSLETIGIATGNWGCGAFGGDPEIKSMIQWLAASQALRSFIHYYTFEEPSLKKLEEVTRWILMHKWTVGDLWNMLSDYCIQRLNRETDVGFFHWLLPASNESGDLHK